MKLWYVLASLSLGMATMRAEAGGEYIGLAQPYLFRDALYINTSRMTRTNRPACATRDLVVLVEGSDFSNPLLKAKFATLLAAWLAEKPVFLAGTGGCSTEGDEVIDVVSP